MTPRTAGPDALGFMLRDLERWVLVGAVGACVACGSLVLLVGLLAALLAGSLATFTGGLPGLGVLPGLSGPSGPAAREIPPDQQAVMRQVAAGSACHLPWTVLAGVAGVESAFGKNMGPSSAGAIGYGQFMPATWAAYGAGGNAWDYHDALPAMDRYLCAMVAEFGIGRSAEDALARALFYYNHARGVRFDPNDSYVHDVLARAASYAGSPVATGADGGGLVAGWASRPALDQYDCRNYRSAAACLTWRDAACSAAALDWLLGAYGVHLAGIDEAIALIGPTTGISTSVGLLDSRGPALVRALAAEGLHPRNARLRSTGELRAWLAAGPLALDGHAWFGVGHWFVAISSDDGGLFTRDSSGHDTTYLSWARLYGEVGWSGWAVGVEPAGGGGPA